jgi:hypothetical protein
MKIRPVGAELLHADRQTDRQAGGLTDRQTDGQKLIVAFHSFANAPENCEPILIDDLTCGLS